MHSFTAACLRDAKITRKGPDDKAVDTGQVKVADSGVACPERNGPKNYILVAGLLSQEENYYRACRGQTYITSVPPSCNASVMEELVGDSLTFVYGTARVTYAMFLGPLP